MRASLSALVVVLGCAGAPRPPARPPTVEEQLREAVVSFLHCVERDGAECKSSTAPYRAFQALDLLVAVRDLAPTRLLRELPRRVEVARDELAAHKRIIRQLADLERPLSLAACGPGPVRPAGPHVMALVKQARERMERLLLHDQPIAADVLEVLEASAQLEALWLVELLCQQGTPVARLAVLFEPAGPVVVGLETTPFLPFAPPQPAPPVHVEPEARWVDPWLPAEPREL